ncbi:MAG: DDE-type integrase/transposase/recombinase [Lachnospiraceae bacterium]|nr:DDE-type integrase/transposase/recombinase [Lachnospiraceae bacterium]
MDTRQNTTKQWQEQEALRRFQMIAPLLDEKLDNAKKLQLRKMIAENNEVSVRSVYRYEKSYQEGQFEGLKPAARQKHRIQNLPQDYGMILEEAIQLRKEVPERSVNQIITILELEGKAAPGVLKRSTLERHLYNAGFGTEHMKAYRDARESSSKRFCKPNRMMLVQADIKYGPKLPIGKNGAKVQTYLSSAIDDHSRLLLYSRFYDNQEEAIVTDTFHQAILKYGKFDACYLDNGTQYTATQLKISLSRLGIRVMHARIRSGKSKGKVEKFHQVVDAFNREAKLKNIRTLEELNRYWELYLEEYYHNKPHDGIREYYESLGCTLPENGISPRTEFNRDKRPLTYIDVSVVAEAFLRHEERKVDKGACISFKGRRYETKPELIGHTVQIAYDPASPEVLTVSYPGYEAFTAKPLKIGPYCDKNPSLPAGMQEQTPKTSRFLDALERRHEESSARQADAISFASYRKEGGHNV